MADITRYQMEINFILNNLDELVNERYLERNGGQAKASTIASNVKSQFIDLMSKIVEDKVSMGELFDKTFNP